MRLMLTITSDFVCVWCFIGVKRLQDALVELPNIKVSISWRPFELNPDMPVSGVNRIEYFDRKFGSSKREEIEERARLAAVDCGLTIDWSRIRYMPNTRDAHVLMSLASRFGKAGQLHDLLTWAHFIGEQNIGDRCVLTRLGNSVGLTSIDISEAFENAKSRKFVVLQETAALHEGVAGVPYFSIQAQSSIRGAIDVASWRETLTMLTQQEIMMT